MCRPDRWDGQAVHLILETGDIHLILTRPVNIGAVLDAEDGDEVYRVLSGLPGEDTIQTIGDQGRQDRVNTGNRPLDPRTSTPHDSPDHPA